MMNDVLCCVDDDNFGMSIYEHYWSLPRQVMNIDLGMSRFLDFLFGIVNIALFVLF